MLEAGAVQDIADMDWGSTALAWATSRGCDTIVRKLVDADANVNGKVGHYRAQASGRRCECERYSLVDADASVNGIR